MKPRDESNSAARVSIAERKLQLGRIGSFIVYFGLLAYAGCVLACRSSATLPAARTLPRVVQAMPPPTCKRVVVILTDETKDGRVRMVIGNDGLTCALSDADYPNAQAAIRTGGVWCSSAWQNGAGVEQP